jgi:hypothetical protein
MKTYPCRFCGNPIIFRTLGSVDESKDQPVARTKSGRLIVAIHINGKCTH